MLADQAYWQYRGQVSAVKRDWPGRITLMQQALVSAYDVLALLDAYKGILANLDLWSSVPGVTDVAKAAQQNSGYDVIAEYNALRASIVTAITRIAQLWPQPGGFCAHESMDATTGQRSARNFTSAQTAQVASDAQSVLNAVSASPA